MAIVAIIKLGLMDWTFLDKDGQDYVAGGFNLAAQPSAV